MKKTFLSVVLSTLLFSTGTVFANVSQILELQAKAEQGDLTAQTELAINYLYGEGVKKDEKKAFEFFKKSAEKGDAVAQYYVGIAYLEAVGTEKNMKLAIEWLEKSAQQNDPDAQYELALMYQQGFGTKKDVKKAFNLMLKASQHQIDAEDFDPEYHLAKMYQQGQGTKKDLTQAFEWMSKSAERQNLLAEYELALMYEKGEGTVKNLEKAIKLYERPADNLVHDAGKRIGDIQLQLAQQKNGKDANTYYEQAAKNYNGQAALVMAKKYAQGDGVAHNKQKALEFYEIFFRSPYSKINPNQPEFISEAMYWVDRLEKSPNDPEVQYQAADKSYNNLFGLYAPYITYQPEKVRQLIQKSAEQGYADAQIKLATIYKNENNITKAFEWYQKAAQQNNKYGQFALGSLYKLGQGVARDLEKAKFWYKKAKESGHKDAQRELEKLGANQDVNFKDVQIDYQIAYDYAFYPPQDVEKAVQFYRLAADKSHSEAQYKLAQLYSAQNDHEKAFQWYEKALNEFDVLPHHSLAKFSAHDLRSRIQYELAKSYEEGLGVKKNPDEALKLYTQAAELGLNRAQYRLADIYEKGLLNVQANPEKALYWHMANSEHKGGVREEFEASAAYVAQAIQKGARVQNPTTNQVQTLKPDAKSSLYYLLHANDVNSSIQLAQLYEKGEGVAQSYADAFMHYRLATSQDRKDPRGYFHLGRLFAQDLNFKENAYLVSNQHVAYKGKDSAVAFYYQQKAAELGHVIAQYIVGKQYDLGDGVAQNHRKAVEWYTKAANQGQRRAQYHLGLKYEKGEGVKQDLDRAIALYHQAADQNLDSAQYALAVKYDKGEGLEKDMQKAFDFYLKAAQQGHVESQYNLGVKYDTGHGVKRDLEQAATWYAKAAEQGYADAQYNLALMYDKGQGVAQDQEIALKWYAKAAQQGQAAAQNHFGVLHDTKGGSLNDMIAVNWYKLAAEQGYADAQYNLAVMYEDGQGVDQSYSKAFSWYEKAANNHHVFAQYNLAWMYEQGQGVKQDYKKAAKLYEAVAKQGHPQADAALQRVKKHLVFGLFS